MSENLRGFISEELGNVDNWNWEFEGATPSYSSVQNPEDICYPQGGQYKVVLTVSNTEGSSEIEHWVTIPELDCPLGEIPNVFTPNGDQVNDVFQFNGLTGDFQFIIVNRWGGVVFETTAPNTFWDGNDRQGNPVSEGVYFYKLIKGDQVKHGFLQLDR